MNTSGVKPINCNVLVRPDDVEEKMGGIILADETREREKHSQTRGTLIARCDDAFHEMSEPPEPGQRVYFAKYEGAIVTGKDDEEYRLLKDIDITGVEA